MFDFISRRHAGRAIALAGTRLRSHEERFGILFFAFALLFAASHGVLAHEFKAGEIVIGHPWSRATPDGAQVAGGYATFRNEGSTSDRLVSVTSAISAKGEIHEMAVTDGVMTMRPLPDGIEIPAGETVELKPGGLHLMFMGLSERPVEGTRFKGTMTFEKAGTVDVEFAVEAVAAKADHGHGNHGGDGGHEAKPGHAGHGD